MVNNNSILSTTTQSFDRFVGTAAVIGLSLVVVLHSWISAPSEEDYEENDVVEEAGCSNHQQQVHNTTAAAASPSRRKVVNGSKSAITTTKSWWWPVAILTRRKNKRRKRIRKQHDGNNDNIANHTTNRHDSYKANEESSYDDDDDDGYCDHLGSCECGSIQFILKGPKHLQPITSPGRIHYPHIQTSATNFQLLKGEADMRFQYVQETNNEEGDYDNNNTTSSVNNTNGDDTSTIATEHIEKHHASSLGAHVFCGNCGVHVMHADRSSEELEVNANCLLEKKKEQQQQQQQPSSVEEEERKTEQRQEQQIQKQTSSMSSLSTIDGDTTTTTDPATLTRSLSQQQHQLNSVSEHELFLGGSAQFWSELDNSQFNTSGDNNNNNNNNKPQELENSQHARTESISSTGEQTHPSSYTNTPTYEGDDYSIDGSLLAPPGGGGGGGGASVVSASLSVNAGLLPPLPPSRLPPLSSTSDSKSVRTLPPWFGERPGYASHPARSVGGGWSVASMETNDLDSVGGESTTIVSPRMRDQMKFYMSRHMKKDKKKSERSGSV